MPRCCVVKNCPTGSRKSSTTSHISLFLAPSNRKLRSLWRNVVPEIDMQGSRQYVCENHFDPEDIRVKSEISGTVKQHSKRSRLNPSAVPLPTVILEPSQVLMEVHPDDVDVDVDSCGDSLPQQYEMEACPRVLSEHNYAGGDVLTLTENTDHFPTNIILDKLKLSVLNSACIHTMDEDGDCSKINAIPLPKLWNVTDLSDAEGSRFYFTHVTLKTDIIPPLPHVDKCVLIDEDRNIQYYVYNQPVSLASKKCPNILYDVNSLPHILSHFENHRICIGLPANELSPADSAKAYKDSFRKWRHKDCTLLATAKYCSFCCKIVHKLKVKYAFVGVENQPVRKSSLDSLKLLKVRKELGREKRQKARAKMRVDALKRQLADIKNESIEVKCAELNMCATETLAVSEIFSAAAKKDSTGHRYSDEWLNLAMQMSMRSPSFYNFLRDIKILPLPCPKTIKKYATSMLTRSGLEAMDLNVVETVEIEHYNI